MTRFQFIIFMIFVLIADGMFQRFAPGIFWFAPVALIGSIVVDQVAEKNSPMFLFAAIAIDLGSGIPFGWVTLTCLGMLGFILVMRRWVRISASHAFFLVVYVALLATVFTTALAYPLGIAMVVRQLPVFLLQSLAPLVMIIVIGMSKRTATYELT